MCNDQHSEYYILTEICTCLRASVCVSVYVDPDSDSDSDLSEIEDDQSGSYASTHSSDSEEEDKQYTPEWWDHTHISKREQGENTYTHTQRHTLMSECYSQ